MLDSHHLNHSNSKLIKESDFHELRIEFKYIQKSLKEIALIYARLINRHKFKCQTGFSASFDKQDEDGQILDQIELNIT